MKIDEVVRILFVEDDSVFKAIISDFFAGNEKVYVRVASSIDEAMETLSSEDLYYDIVVLDWWMTHPKTLRQETTKGIIQYLKEKESAALMVVFTSYDHETTTEDTLGVPVVGKNLRSYLKEQIDIAIRSKGEIVEALKVIQESIDFLKGTSR